MRGRNAPCSLLTISHEPGLSIVISYVACFNETEVIQIAVLNCIAINFIRIFITAA